jgi:hypothetical protein
MTDIRSFPNKMAADTRFQCQYFLCVELDPLLAMKQLVEPANSCSRLLQQLLNDRPLKDGEVWQYELEDVRMILQAVRNPLVSEQDRRRWVLLELQEQPDFELYAIAIDGVATVLKQLTNVPDWEEMASARQLVIALNDLHDRIMTAVHPDGQALLEKQQLVRGL